MPNLEVFQSTKIDETTDYRAIKFKAWLKDPRPEFNSQAKKDEDKFAELISLGSQFTDVVIFFSSEVGVSAGTITRWASGRSKPSKFVGPRLVQETKEAIATALISESERTQSVRFYAGSNIYKL